LALNKSVVSVYCIPAVVKDDEETADRLAPILGVEEKVLMDKFDSDEKSEWLLRDTTPEMGKEVMGLGLRGIFIEPAERRVYPEGALAANLLGYVGSRDGSLAGIENAYNRYLEGLPGLQEGVGDARGQTLPDLTDVYVPPLHGLGIQLTIDKWCQYVAERELKSAVREHNAAGGVVVIMEPDSGAVLAMASSPTYDPNEYNEYPVDNWRNNAITYQYEPGSVAKPFVMAAALDGKVVGRKEVFDVSKKLAVGRATISDIRPVDNELTLDEIIARSSNIGIVQVSNRLGGLKQYEYFKSFGFGEATDIGLPAENRGSVRYGEVRRPVGRAMAAFGQGWSATPLQVTAAACALANGGKLMRPMIVKSVVDGVGKSVYDFQPEEVRSVVAPKVADDVLLMMEGAVEFGGGSLAKLEGYRVAGKTGTSEVARKNGRGYAAGVYNSSFLGIVPANDPKLVILVVLFEPRGEYFGGKIAAPVFARIAEDVLPALKIPPTGSKNISPGPGKTPRLDSCSLTGLEPYEAILAYGSAGERVRFTGTDDLEKDVIGRDESEARRLLYVGDPEESVKMPDVRGLSAREALRILAPYCLDISVSGTGSRVTGQSPGPGAKTDGICKLKLGKSKRI
ncbi:MAG: transpeptidase family protein, partial [bacterium]|nr:transpeptidase family protein [bacterium]